MPSAWQTLPIALVGGIDTKTDSKLLPPPKLSVLENGVFVEHGTLRHRSGYDVTRPVALDGTDIGNPVGLTARDNELVLAADGKLHSYDDTTDRWIPAGPLEFVTTAQANLASTNSAQTFADTCTHNGITVAAWADSRGGVYASAYSSVTGAPFATDVLIDVDGAAPALCIVDGIVMVFWYNDSAFDIKALRITPFDVAASLAGTPVIVRADAHATIAAWDVVSLGTTAALAYATTIGGEEVHLAIVNQAGVTVSSSAISETSLPVQAIAICAGPTNIYTAVALDNTTTSHIDVGTWPRTNPYSGSAQRLEEDVPPACRTAIAPLGESAVYYWQETDAEHYNHVVHWREIYTPALELPNNASEWAATFPTITVPDSLWPCQDITLPIVDTIGAADLNAFGSAIGKVFPGQSGDPLDRLSVLLGLDASAGQRAAHIRAGTGDFDIVTDDFTALMRFKFTEAPGTDQFLMRKKSVSTTGIGWAVQTNVSGHISIVVDSSASTFSVATIGADHNDGAFHFIMATLDWSAGLATIYSDLGSASVDISAHSGAGLSNGQIFGLGDTQGNLTACARGEYSYALALIGTVYSEADFDLISSVGAPVTPPTEYKVRHSKLASAAFEQGDFTYVHLLQQSTLQSSYFLYRSDAHLCGRYNYGLAGDQSADLRLPSVQNTSTDEHVLALRTKRRLDIALTSTGSDKYTHDNFKRTVHSFTDPTSFHAVQSGGATYIAGGLLWQYDGAAPVEAGFLLFPENGSSVDATTDSPAILAGTYNYRVYYEWTNGAGERERSSAVQFQHPAFGVTSRVTVTIPTLAHTLKQGDRSDVAIVVYRTESLGTSFYRCSSPNPAVITGNNPWVFNNPDTDTVTFVDNMPDAVLRTKEGDYQNSGEFDNVAPDSGSILARTSTRLFLAGGCIPSNIVLHSKARGLGQPAGEFNGNLTIRVDEEGGPVTALAELNGDLVIFKRDRIYAVSGEGPNDLGGGQFYGTPRLIASDVGCSKPRTVALTPSGLMFVSDRGIYLLNPSQGVQYIGAAVEAFNGQDYTATTVLPTQNLVVFLTSSGKTVVYDYLFDQWSTWTNHTGIGAVLYGGDTLAYLDSEARVLQQNPDNFTDGGVPYPLHFRLAPIRPPGAGIQGHWRLRRVSALGEYLSSHQLVMSLYYDRDSHASERVVFDPDSVLNLSEWGDADLDWGDASELWGGTGSREYQFELRVARQKCETVSLDFYDIPGVPAGAGFELTEIALEWAPKTGLTKQSADRKV